MADERNQIESILSLAGGINTGAHRTIIKGNQAADLHNVDLSIPGLTAKRKGMKRVGSDMGAYAILDGARFKMESGLDMMIVLTAEPALYTYVGSDWTKVSYPATPVAATEGKIIIANNVAYLLTNSNNVHSYDQSSISDEGSGNTNPPDNTTVGLWHKNRLLVADESTLYYSGSLTPAVFNKGTNAHKIDYAASNKFKALVRAGSHTLFCVYDWGTHAIETNPYVSNWSASQASSKGTIAPKSVVLLGAIPCMLDRDGFWRLDKPNPISTQLKDGWFDRVNWPYAHKAVAHVWDNRIFLAMPVDGSEVNNVVFVYHYLHDPNGVGDGWTVWKSDTMHISCFWEMDFDGEKKLYAGCADDSTKVWEMESGYTDDGEAYEFKITTKGYVVGASERMKAGIIAEIRGSSTDNSTVIRLYGNQDAKGFKEIYINDETLERFDLKPNHPQLPITLPFTLINDKIMSGKFPLYDMREWEDIQLRISDNATATGKVEIMHQRVVAIPQPFEERTL